jgi:hypothetical protein
MLNISRCRRRRAVTGLGAAVVLATTLCGASVASAVSGQQRPASHGTERIEIMGTSAKSGVASVIATGAFTAGGSINLDANTGKVTLDGGTLRLAPKFGPSRTTFSKATCLLTITGHGTYTLGRGTGDFAGISGSGRFAVSIRQVDARKANGACATTEAAAYQGVITGTGPVTLGS